MKVERIVAGPDGGLFKDPRKINFGQEMVLKKHDIQYDLCSVIEHLGNHNEGHYLCAKRNFVMVKPFMESADIQETSFKYANWNLISDESSFILEIRESEYNL